MRFNKIYIPVCAAFLAMTFQSCLKDQEDIFDDPATVRLQEYLDKTKSVLTSSENGWLFDYFPDRYYSYGGFLYSLEFTQSNVTVGCVLAPGEYETSLYKLTDDNGPSLSFDTYNSLMHFFATPSSGAYEAYDGDFEFMIMDVQNDLITLRGKRTGNTMYLRRAEENVKSYMDKVAQQVEDQMFTEAEGTIGSTQITAFIDVDINAFFITLPDESEYGEFFFPTPEGIRFVEPLDINGASISTLDFTIDKINGTGTYTGTDSQGNAINIIARMPADYSFIDAFDGSFRLVTNLFTVNCTLVADVDAGTVTIKGLNANFDLLCTYNRSMGCIQLQNQTIGTYSGYPVYFGAGTSSSFYPGPGNAGVYFIKDVNNPNTFNAISDGRAASNTANCSFILVYQTATGYSVAPTTWRISSQYQFVVQSLQKQ